MKSTWNYLDHPILRWLYPELSLCRTQFERMEAATRGRQASPAINRQIALPIVLFVVYMAAVPVIYIWARPYWLPMWSMSLVMTPMTFVFLIGITLAVRSHARLSIRKYLLDRGVAVCLNCGYDLRGLDATTLQCPECGSSLNDQTKAIIRAPQADAPAQ